MNNKLLESIYSDNEELYGEKSSNTFRYAGLIRAIEFFSQKFSLEEIIKHIYNFVNELIISDDVCVFVKSGNKLVPKYAKGYKETPSLIIKKDINKIVYYHAGLLEVKILNEYFEIDSIDYYNPQLTLQLIMDKELLGLIFISRDMPKLVSDDRIIAEALMNLFYTSLTNYASYNKLEKTMKQLDEKVFNLFAVNQSTKALMSELDIDRLKDLSISVFSELTQSSVTALFMYNDASEQFEIQKMRDVFNPNRSAKCSLKLINTNCQVMSHILDCRYGEAYETFLSHFDNGQCLKEHFNPEYILLIRDHDQMLGFVVLERKVTGSDYHEYEFELIESIVSSTIIAMRNSLSLKEIEEKRTLITEKFSQMTILNDLMKNINTATNPYQLYELLTTTLSVAFGFRNVFLLVFETEFNQGYDCEETLKISETYVFNDDNNSMERVEIINSNFETKSKFENGPILIYSEEKARDYTADLNLAFQNTDIQGLVLMPVNIIIEASYTQLCIGVESCWNGRIFDEENMLILDSIAQHVSPVLYQFNKVNDLLDKCGDKVYDEFEIALHKSIVEAKEYSQEFNVIHINSGQTFRRTGILSIVKEILEDIPSKYIFEIDKTNILVLDVIITKSQQEQLLSQKLKINTIKYDNDFNDCQSFENYLSSL